MNWIEACKELAKGHKVRRPSWVPHGDHIKLFGNIATYVPKDDKPSAMRPQMDSFLATDWEVIPEEVIPEEVLNTLMAVVAKQDMTIRSLAESVENIDKRLGTIIPNNEKKRF